MGVEAITSYEEFRKIITSDTPVAVDFWATWCGPCRVISPIFEELSEKYPGVKFYKVDVDEQDQISQEVGIRAMPTFVVFQNGSKVDTVVGASASALEQLIDTVSKDVK